MQTLGSQSDLDLSFVHKKKVSAYIKQLEPTTPVSTLQSKFPKTSAALIEILSSLLEFNPKFRPTASDCLKHSIFDSVRNPSFERDAPTTLHQPIYAEGVYDYELGCDVRYTMEDYKEMLANEVAKTQGYGQAKPAHAKSCLGQHPVSPYHRRRSSN